MESCRIKTAPYANNISGWFASLELEFELRERRTILARNRHTGPLRVQRLLYPEESVCHTYILHPPGGVVGGDRLETHAAVKTGAATLATTPGATKFYRSGGRKSFQENLFGVENGGSLEWFPQETIVYPGAEANIITRINLEKEAGFIGWDVMCIGLPACNQTFASGYLDTSIEINREGRPLFTDRLRIRGADDLDRPAGMRGFSVCASFMAAGATSEMPNRLRKKLETKSDCLTGITLMDDLLVARYLGNSSFEAKKVFETLWTWLRPRLSGREACPPGIWST